MRIAILDDHQRAALTSANWGGLGADVTVFTDRDGDVITVRYKLGDRSAGLVGEGSWG